ncbi:MAG: hypothetical protein IJ242_13915 [Clostridia bacterium]|nr:hypothetical protein [Clostridia bacterium]
MSKVYRNKAAIPIPDGLIPKPSDGRISVSVDVNGVTKPITIGYAATPYTMFVNDAFRDIYPLEWAKYYGTEAINPDRLYIGCYALTFGIIHKIKLYTLLLQTYEPGITNAILDYAMYSLLDRTDVTQLYTDRMQDEVLFSNTVYSDSWYSDFFKKVLTTKAAHEFRMKWLIHCKETGIKKVWLSIDGSNNDCEVKESDLSEYGYAKSHNDSKIVSFIYAVDAENGRPVTYFVNPGSVVDSKSFMEIAAALKDASMEIEGVILDSTFCTYEVIQTIISCGYDFVIMTPCDTYGHTSLMESDGEKIKWKSRFCVSEGGIFGTSRKHVLFQNHPDLEVYVNLFFDGIRGAHQSDQFCKQIRTEMARVQNKLDSLGKKRPGIKSEFQKYLQIRSIDGHDTVVPCYDTWDLKMAKKGFFSIATSKDFGAEKTLQLYGLRDMSEVGYCFIKSHQGFSATRVHSTEGIESKFAVCFVGNIIRQEIFLACKELDLATNETIQKLDCIYLRRGISDSYYDVKMQTTRQLDLLSKFNIGSDDFQQLAADLNKRRNTPISNNVYPFPTHNKPAEVKSRKRGRQKGSKNKKTLEKEAAIQAMILSGIDPSALNPKKGAGRPKGKKDTVPRKRRTKAEIEKERSSGSGIPK